MRNQKWVKFGVAALLFYLVLQNKKKVPFFVTQYIPSGPVSPPVPIGF